MSRGFFLQLYQKKKKKERKKGFTKCKGGSDLMFSIVLLTHLDNPGSPFPVFS